jgi:rhodanese-related sulfurtransferase/thiol-disulfide isomerase/thioredoxin
MTYENSIIEITDHSFAERVVQSEVPVLLAFCADDCSASQKLLTLLASAAPRCRGSITIAKASPDESPGLAARFGVVSAPAVLLFSGGKVCYQFVGELSRRELDELLTRACAGRPVPAVVEPKVSLRFRFLLQNQELNRMKTPRKIVIVGGVAGGASAAARARRVDENAEIHIFERGPYNSFANCGLPYYIAGEIDDRAKLIVMTPENFWARSRVHAHVNHEVLSINRAAKTIHVKAADGFSFFTSLTRDNSHAHYYPGAKPVLIKVIAEEGTGRLLGAQVMGETGVDKRVDVLATAIAGKMSVFDLENLDLAYSPPFGSANDPVNVAGFVAGHIARGDIATVAPETWKPDGELLLDVRDADEVVEFGKLPNAVNIPLTQLRDRLGELPRNRRIITYCQKGQRGYLAACALRGHGFENVANRRGGFLQARLNGLPAE